MKKLNKKAAFDTINKGMVAFISFVLIAILVVLLVEVTKETNIICPETFVDGVCFSCQANYTYNASGNVCCNSTGLPAYDCGSSANRTAITEYTGSSYNATKDMSEAAALPPQFAQIIIIVVIIVGILALLGGLGYMTYQKIKK